MLMFRSVPVFSNNQLSQKSTIFLKYYWTFFIHCTTSMVSNIGTEMSELKFYQSERRYRCGLLGII